MAITFIRYESQGGLKDGSLNPNESLIFNFKLPHDGHIEIRGVGYIVTKATTGAHVIPTSTSIVPKGWNPPDGPEPHGPVHPQPGPHPKDPPDLNTTPIPTRTELFGPSGIVATVDDNPQTVGGKVLSFDTSGSASQTWTAKITNLHTAPAWVVMQYSYPGLNEIWSFTEGIPLAQAFLRTRLTGSGVHIDQGICSLQLGTYAMQLAFPAQFKFSVGPFTATAYAHNINSSSVDISLNNATPQATHGFVKIDVRFQENGDEIYGTWHGNITNMTLSLTLNLDNQYWKAGYNRGFVDFAIGDIDLKGFPDNLAEWRFSYKEKLIQNVREAVYEQINAPITITQIGQYFTNLLLGSLGVPLDAKNNAIGRVTDLDITNSIFNLTYTKDFS